MAGDCPRLVRNSVPGEPGTTPNSAPQHAAELGTTMNFHFIILYQIIYLYLNLGNIHEDSNQAICFEKKELATCEKENVFTTWGLSLLILDGFAISVWLPSL